MSYETCKTGRQLQPTHESDAPSLEAPDYAEAKVLFEQQRQAAKAAGFSCVEEILFNAGSEWSGQEGGHKKTAGETATAYVESLVRLAQAFNQLSPETQASLRGSSVIVLENRGAKARLEASTRQLLDFQEGGLSDDCEPVRALREEKMFYKDQWESSPILIDIERLRQIYSREALYDIARRLFARLNLQDPDLDDARVGRLYRQREERRQATNETREQLSRIIKRCLEGFCLNRPEVACQNFAETLGFLHLEQALSNGDLMTLAGLQLLLNTDSSKCYEQYEQALGNPLKNDNAALGDLLRKKLSPSRMGDGLPKLKGPDVGEAIYEDYLRYSWGSTLLSSTRMRDLATSLLFADKA